MLSSFAAVGSAAAFCRRRCALALAVVLISCSASTEVAVRAPGASTAPPTATPTTAPTPTSARTASPSPTASPALSPTATPTLIVRASGSIHYVAMGASDTVGLGSLDPANGSWPSRVAALLPQGSTYRNLGVSGSLAAQAQRDQLPVAVREQPTVVTVWLAVNDLNRQVLPQTYAASLGAIVETLAQQTSARIFVGNVPDLRAVPVYAALDPLVLLGLVQTYNSEIAAVAAKNAGRVVLVDLFSGSADLVTQITVASDGFHPSDAGYVLISQRFADAMRKSGIALRAGA